eukprot:365725-Chlamydomonas_euryale.AAC.12
MRSARLRVRDPHDGACAQVEIQTHRITATVGHQWQVFEEEVSHQACSDLPYILRPQACQQAQPCVLAGILKYAAAGNAFASWRGTTGGGGQ